MSKTTRSTSLTPGQALFILEKLIDEGKVSASDIRRLLGSMWEEMTTIERRIEELRGAAAPMAHPVRAARKVTSRIKRAASRFSSSDRAASMKTQGQYLGYLTQIAKEERPKYKALAQASGREAAIAAMKRALGK